MELLLTPESVRVVALALLNAALTAYLVRVPRAGGAARWLAAFTAATAGLYLCRAVEASVAPLPAAALWATKATEFLVVMGGLGALVQVAYRFIDAPFRREARAVLAATGLVLLASAAFVWSLGGQPGAGERLMATYSFAWIVAEGWAIVVLLRKRRRARRQEDDRAARAFAAFAAVSFADLLVLVAIVGLMLADPPTHVRELGWVFGIIPAIFAIHYARVAVYIGHAPEPTSLRAKLVGLALAMVLAVIGMAATLSAGGTDPNLERGMPTALERRAAVHDAVAPLFALLFVGAAFALVAFPWALRGSLVGPVERLLQGVRRVNAGERDVAVPTGVRDEVGRLTEGFNQMTRSLREAEADLRTYAAGLEARVAERTAALQASKAEVEAQAERLEELDRLKTRLFANLSHEFRTPLTLLLGPIDDALAGRAGEIPAPLAGQLPAMQQSARRLLTLVNQLLDLAKLEAGALAFDPAPTDLAALARSAAAAFAGQAERGGVGLLVETAETPLVAEVDAGQIETVLTNLLANALAFTGRGGKVRLSVAAASGHATLAVADTGTGIAPDALPYVFDRFRQADGSATRAHGGTGIGLALAKELTERHGGTISVESAVGFGTTFTVRLPLAEVAVAEADDHTSVQHLALPAPVREASPVVERVPEPDPADGRPLVLLVEDHADLREYVRQHLAGRYRVLEAADGAAGLAAARAHRPDLVLSDVMMPRLDGVGLTRALRADPALADVPVVLLTAWTDEASTLAGLEAGADDYLGKPFSPDELVARVENFVSARRRLRARYSEEVVVGPSRVVVPSAEAAFLASVRDAAEAGLPDADFGADALADAVGLSRRQLGRRLKAALGTSPGAFLREIRMARAAQLLAQEAGTVSEVAYAVGYRDPAHFAKQFRKHHGAPPSAYAERAGGDGAA